MGGIEGWFLTAAQRGNPACTLPAWCMGNMVEPLVHGATYFDRLVDEVAALRRGDYLFFTDWRGDPDQLMRPGGPTVRELFGAAAERGVVVKGLLWRSHLDRFRFSEQENQHLGEAIERAGGEVLLDQRVRLGGLAPPETGGGAAPGGAASATSRSPAASTCATAAATTRPTTVIRSRWA